MPAEHIASRTRSTPAFFTLTALFLFALLLPGAAPLSAQDRHLVWTVETGESRVTLMGSLHTLRQDEYPLPPVFQKAYAEADGLVFETDMAQMQDPATQARLLSLGLYPEGQTLQEHLSPEGYQALADALAERGLPPAQFARFKPWFCAFTLVMLEFQRLGYHPQNGLDMHFYRKATQDGKALYHLEPVEAQLELLASLEGDDQEDFLFQSLQEMEILDAKASQMTAAWRTGDADDLQEIIRMSFEGYPDLYDRFMTRRNRNWLPSVEQLIRDGKNVLVIVGAGHLVGPESLVQLLEDRGYPVEQQ